MLIACFDLEGVLVPEVWLEVAKSTGLESLNRTTRDEPDYDKLMRGRLEILKKHGIGISEFQKVVAKTQPLEGAREFLDWVRSRCQVVILSDTFYQFAEPLMVQLGRPTLFCHDLSIDADGTIRDYRLRIKDPKRRAIESFRENRFKTLAVGDSYNDVSMLSAADEGIFFRAPENIRREFPLFAAYDAYADLQNAICAILERCQV